MSVLEVEHLKVAYPGRAGAAVETVRDVSFRVAEGGTRRVGGATGSRPSTTQGGPRGQRGP
ncbi:methionine ABC transporter ATP-binding protein, partial [Streptomyces sp. NPDC058953]